MKRYLGWAGALGMFALAGACAEPYAAPTETENVAEASPAALAANGVAWAYVHWTGSTYVVDATRSHNTIGTTTLNTSYAADPFDIVYVNFGQPTSGVENRGTWLISAVSPNPVMCSTNAGATFCAQQSVDANGTPTQTRVHSDFVIGYYRNQNAGSGKSGAYGRFTCTSGTCNTSQYYEWTSLGKDTNGWLLYQAQEGNVMYASFVGLDPGVQVNGATVPHAQVSAANDVSLSESVTLNTPSALYNLYTDYLIWTYGPSGAPASAQRVNVALWGAGGNSFPAPGGSYFYADQPTYPLYLANAANAWRTDGTYQEMLSRQATGKYGAVTLAMTNASTAAPVSFVTGHGYDGHFCNVESYNTTTTSHQVNVNCYTPAGVPVDSRYAVATFRKW